LWLEHCFVALHNKVAAQSEAQIDFSMTPDKTNARSKWFKACWRPHLWLFYGAIIVIDAVGIFLIRSK
jgi:hypothetical protein